MRRTVLIAALAALCACQRTDDRRASPTPVAPASSAPFLAPAGFTRLRVSSTPHLDPGNLKTTHQPLADYLAGHLRVEVEMQVAESYDEVGQQLGRGEVDLAEFSPFAYVRAIAANPGLLPIADSISEGSATSGAYVVVRAESALHTLEDLRGKSLGFVDPASTSGYLLPMRMFKERGIDPATYFSLVEFTGNHEALLLSVLEGRIDSGATYQGAMPALQRSKGIDPLSFRIIAKTGRSPHDVFCVRPGLPAEVTAELERLLLSVSSATPDGRRILAPMAVNGFTPHDEHRYDEVREAFAAIADGGPR